MGSPLDVRRGSADVSIVGAGPAGASLAIWLARRGLRVELFDRARFPRDKVCGDFLGPRCLPLLAELGLLDEVLRAAGTRIEGMRLWSQRGREVVARYALLRGVAPGIGIERERLDLIFVEAARAAGVMVTLGARVDPASLSSPLVVGADGRGSRVARAFGIGRRAGRGGGYAVRAYFAAGPRLEAMGEIHLTPWGYAGLGPVGNGRVNASIVVKDGRRRSLLHEMRALPTLAGRVDLDNAVPAAIKTLAPLRHTPRGVVNGRALLVGDAAQLLDPITGEGVYHALRSSQMAASVIPGALHEGVDRRQALRRYARLHASEFRERLVVSRAVQALLPLDLATEAVGILLSRSPRLAARAIGYAGNVRERSASVGWGLVPHRSGRRA